MKPTAAPLETFVHVPSAFALASDRVAIWMADRFAMLVGNVGADAPAGHEGMSVATLSAATTGRAFFMGCRLSRV